MNHVKVAGVELSFPASAQVGDTLAIVGEARITGIREDLIDATDLGHDSPRYTVGGRTYEILIKAHTA